MLSDARGSVGPDHTGKVRAMGQTLVENQVACRSGGGVATWD